MRPVKPKRLKKGDLIGIISPASTPEDSFKFEESVTYIEKLGYRVKIGKNALKSEGYLAGIDKERLSDFHEMFKDKNVKAIFCSRGGYGAFRLLEKIDYKIVKNNPKIFVGYSEITALQMAILHKTGLVTFAGPMPAKDFVDEIDPYTEENFWRMITSEKKMGRLKFPDGNKLPGITKGNATGRMIGGNLSVLSPMINSDFLPPFKDKIIMLEDVGEVPYKIDRMLNQLRISGAFKKMNGLLLGRFVDCFEHDPTKKTLTLGEVMEDYLGAIKKPVIYTFPHGHIDSKLTLGFGLMMKMNATRGFVEITEGGVK